MSNYKANKMSLVNERYHIQEKLGQGSFGVVFHGIDTKLNERVAVKVEVKTSSLLAREAQVYKLLRHGIGFPKGINYSVCKFIHFLILIMTFLNLKVKLSHDSSLIQML